MVDLIPEEYRRRLRARRLLQRFGWSCLGVAAFVGLAAGALTHLVRGEREAFAHVKQAQMQGRAQQARLTEIKGRRDAAREQLRVLERLRGEVSTKLFFDAVDAALNERIWFQELSISRGKELKDKQPGSGQPAATAAPATPGNKVAAEGQEDGAWRHRERAEIRGLAGDHAALTGFIRQLGSQSGVSQVRLLDTSPRSYPGLQLIEFQVVAMLGVSADAAP